MKFAKAIYCSGVGSWYVQFGTQSGVDVMLIARSESQAKMHEKLINKSLTRELKQRGYSITPKPNKPTLKKL